MSQAELDGVGWLRSGLLASSFEEAAAPRDYFAVPEHPKMTPAADAEDIRDDEPVIGVAFGNEAKAYPLSVMGRHELANDTCGGRPIAVSW